MSQHFGIAWVQAAVKLARAVNYVGAGTVEFLVADTTREFYFLEMNTRLQVEHPVTELVTGIDLVREQITVAARRSALVFSGGVRWRGHAIECRVYAEDPDNNFFPSPGRINYLRVPFGPGIRDDSGVEMNSEVSIHYDPLISKLAAWGRTRDEAIDRLRRALDEYEVGGIKTTLPFFREIVRDEEFTAGRLDTGFISRFFERRETRAMADVTENTAEQDVALIAAALQYTQQQRAASASRPSSGDVESRWKMSGRVLGRDSEPSAIATEPIVNVVKLKAKITDTEHDISLLCPEPRHGGLTGAVMTWMSGNNRAECIC